MKKKKGESTDPSNLIIFPTELARSFNKLISVCILYLTSLLVNIIYFQGNDTVVLEKFQ